MRAWRLLVLGWFAAGVVACGGDGTSVDAAAGTDGPGGPACVAGRLSLFGDLNGQSVALEVAVTSSSFQQLTVPHSYDLTYVGGTLHLEWTGILPFGKTTAATGTFVMPAGAARAGETICAGSATLKYVNRPGVPGGKQDTSFTLGGLSAGPTCPGAALAGNLDGCAGD